MRPVRAVSAAPLVTSHVWDIPIRIERWSPPRKVFRLFRIIQCTGRGRSSTPRASDASPSSDSGRVSWLSIVHRNDTCWSEGAREFLHTQTLPALAVSTPTSDIWQSAWLLGLARHSPVRHLSVHIGLTHLRLQQQCHASRHQVDLNDQQQQSFAIWFQQGGMAGHPNEWRGPPNHNYTVTDHTGTTANPLGPSGLLMLRLLSIICYGLQGNARDASSYLGAGLHTTTTTASPGQTQRWDTRSSQVLVLLLHHAVSMSILHSNDDLYRALVPAVHLGVDTDSFSRFVIMCARSNLLFCHILDFAVQAIRLVGSDPLSTVITRDTLLHDIRRLQAALGAWTAAQTQVPDGSFPITKTHRPLSRVVTAHLTFSTVFVSCLATRYQTSYDRYFSVSANLGATLRTVLLETRQLVQPKNPWLVAPHLGLVSQLWHVMVLCCHPGIRRDALALLELCPQVDGVLDVHNLRCAGEFVVGWEEGVGDGLPDAAAAMEGRTLVVPEENRLCMVHLVPAGGDGAELLLNLTYKPCGDGEYVKKLVSTAR